MKFLVTIDDDAGDVDAMDVKDGLADWIAMALPRHIDVQKIEVSATSSGGGSKTPRYQALSYAVLDVA